MTRPTVAPHLPATAAPGAGGRVLVKCMDYVSSRQFCAGRHFVVTTALDLGLRQVDEFVHYSGLGPQPLRDRQEHSRRAHSYLCVFRVPKRRARRPTPLERP